LAQRSSGTTRSAYGAALDYERWTCGSAACKAAASRPPPIAANCDSLVATRRKVSIAATAALYLLQVASFWQHAVFIDIIAEMLRPVIEEDREASLRQSPTLVGSCPQS